MILSVTGKFVFQFFPEIFSVDSPIQCCQVEIAHFFEKNEKFHGQILLQGIPFVLNIFSFYSSIQFFQIEIAFFFEKIERFYSRVLFQNADPLCPHFFSFYSRFHPEIMVSANKKKKCADKWDPLFGAKFCHKMSHFFKKICDFILK